MSDAAEWIRKRLMQARLDGVLHQARSLHLTIHVAWGMGGQAPAWMHDRLDEACREAERITLEYQVTL